MFLLGTYNWPWMARPLLLNAASAEYVRVFIGSANIPERLCVPGVMLGAAGSITSKGAPIHVLCWDLSSLHLTKCLSALSTAILACLLCTLQCLEVTLNFDGP